MSLICLGNPLKLLKETVDASLKSKNKANRFFDLSIIVAFGLVFFSIPACSFSSKLNLLTWIFVGVLLVLIALDAFLFYKIHIDIIVVSLLLFCASAFVSSFLNGFRDFSPTYFLLTFFVVLIYSFCKANAGIGKLLLISAYCGSVAFLLLFIVKYSHELLSFDIDRLGGFFGDENDIAIFNCIGALFSLYFLIFNSNLFVKIGGAVLSILFIYCAVSSGSKIVVLLLFFSLVVFIFSINKKNRVWLSFVEIGCVMLLGFAALNLPFASGLKDRFLDMIYYLFGNGKAGSVDISTSDRISMFLDGLQLFLKKPAFGFGINGFSNFGGFNNGWSHNHISEMLCDTGLIGFVFYHVPFVISLTSSFRCKGRFQILPFSVLFFFIVAMLSIALPGEKMFAFIIGVVYAELSDAKPFFILDMSSLFAKRKKQNENRRSY